MKLSAKKMQEKTKVHSEKKALLAKKIAEETVRKKALDTKNRKIIKNVTDRCFQAAIEGQKIIRLGIKTEEKNIELVGILNPDVFPFDIEQIDMEFDLVESLHDLLKTLSPKEVGDLKLAVRKHAIQLYDTLQDLNDDPELTNAEEYLEEAIHAEVEFKEQIIALQNAYNFLDYYHTTIDSDLLDEIDTNFNSLRALLIGCDFFTINTDDSTDLEISWEKFSCDDCVNTNRPVNDYLNPVGLGWISSDHGQLFISSLENLIDDLIENNQTETVIRLTKTDSKYEITLENKSKTYSLLSEQGLYKFFKKLGYSASIKSTKVSTTFDLHISWNNSK